MTNTEAIRQLQLIINHIDRCAGGAGELILRDWRAKLVAVIRALETRIK